MTKVEKEISDWLSKNVCYNREVYAQVDKRAFLQIIEPNTQYEEHEYVVSYDITANNKVCFHWSEISLDIAAKIIDYFKENHLRSDDDE